MASWHARMIDTGAHTDVLRIHDGEAPLAWRDAIEPLTESGELRAFLRDLLVSSRFDAFFWETPPITVDTLEQPFEMALVDAPRLAGTAADPEAFAERFTPDRDVAVFPNLGRDALLVVPCPRGPSDAYAHLASFVRSAPARQIDALFREVGGAVAARVSEAPMWLSTAGLGVAWLHVRLDDRPKYYRHAPYTRFPR